MIPQNSMDRTEATIDRWRSQDVPILPLAEIEQLPEPADYDAGIYFLWLNGALVYIGKSANLPERVEFLYQMKRRGPLHAGGASAKYIPFDKLTALVLQNGFEIPPWLRPMLQKYERAYIAAYLPAMNEDFEGGLT